MIDYRPMLTGVLIVLLFLIALLAIPVTLTFDVSWPKASHQDTVLNWAFGLVKLRIPASAPKESAAGDDRSKRKSDRSKHSQGKSPNVSAAFGLKPFRQRIVRFLGDLWHAVQKKDLSLRVRLGLGDPADTGQLWAIVGPVAGLMANVRDAAVSIEPDFSASTFELNSAGSIRLVPLRVIFLTAGLLLSPPIWQGVIKMREGGR